MLGLPMRNMKRHFGFNPEVFPRVSRWMQNAFLVVGQGYRTEPSMSMKFLLLLCLISPWLNKLFSLARRSETYAKRTAPPFAWRGRNFWIALVPKQRLSWCDLYERLATIQLGRNVILGHVEGSSTVCSVGLFIHAFHEGSLELRHLVLGADGDADIVGQRRPGASN